MSMLDVLKRRALRRKSRQRLRKHFGANRGTQINVLRLVRTDIITGTKPQRNYSLHF
jgi:hypothetical protein